MKLYNLQKQVYCRWLLNWENMGIHIVPSTSWPKVQKCLETSGISGCKWQVSSNCCFLFKYHWRFSPYPDHLQREDWMVPPKVSLFSRLVHYTFQEPLVTKEVIHQCIDSIILPYISSMREVIDHKDATAVMIMENFWGQVTLYIPFTAREQCSYLLTTTKHYRLPTALWHFSQQACKEIYKAAIWTVVLRSNIPANQWKAWYEVEL